MLLDVTYYGYGLGLVLVPWIVGAVVASALSALEIIGRQ